MVDDPSKDGGIEEKMKSCQGKPNPLPRFSGRPDVEGHTFRNQALADVGDCHVWQVKANLENDENNCGKCNRQKEEEYFFKTTFPYMQKTCDVAEKAILAKKNLRKKCVNRDKSA